jgi:hypothetical protein
MNNNLHLGKLVLTELKRQGRSQAWLAKEMHKDPSCLRKTLKMGYVYVPLLYQISRCLQHDFFDYRYSYLKENG